MTNFVVSSGVTSSGVTVALSDTMQIRSGGIASATHVSGGVVNVSGASFFTNLTTFNSSTETVFSGASATQTTVDVGTQVVSAGGLAISTTVNAFGTVHGMIVSSGGVASAALVNQGGG